MIKLTDSQGKKINESSSVREKVEQKRGDE